VFIPSEDLDVRMVEAPNATMVNVTVLDSLLTKIAYTSETQSSTAVLNTTLHLKAGELYIFTMSTTAGCALQPPSIRTITPEGTWFVQDMWCKDQDNCPMAVKLYPRRCESPKKIETKPEKPPSVNVPLKEVEATLPYIEQLILVSIVFVIAVITGISYSIGRRHHGKVLTSKNIIEKR
jgi:hypothetical protein